MHAMHLSGPVALGFILLLNACASEPPALRGGEIREDSSGIEIVSSDWSDEGPIWRRIAGEPLIVLGADEDDERTVLAGVAGAELLPGGRIVIANGQTSQLLLHDSLGALERAVGGPGDGPGEFRRIGALWRLGTDTIAVYDARLRRVVVLDRTGTIMRTVAPALAPGGGGAPVHAVLGIFGDGSMLARYSRSFRERAQPGALRPDDALFLYGASGDTARELATFPGQELHLTRMPSGGLGIAVAAFGRNTLVAVRGDHYAVGNTDFAEVRIFRRNGTPVRFVRWRRPAIAVSGEHIDRHVEGGLGTTTGESRQQMMRARREMVTHSTLPAFSTMLVDYESRLWVRRYDGGEPTDGSWDVFSADGARLGVVSMNREWSLLAASDDRMLVLMRDSLDRELVRLYGLEP